MGWVGVELLPEGGGGNGVTDGEGEEVDDFCGGAAEEVGSEDVVRAVFEEDFVAGAGFGDAAGLVPVGGEGGVAVEFEPQRAGVSFGEADGGEGREGEDDGGDAGVVDALMVAVEEVGGGGDAVVGGDGGEGRAGVGDDVSGGVDGGVGDALEEVVDVDAVVIGGDVGGCEIEVGDVGSAAGGVDDEVGGEGAELA